MVKALEDSNEELFWFAENPVGLLDEQPQIDPTHHHLPFKVRVHHFKVIR